MQKLYLTIVFSILTLVTFSQTYYRQTNESVEGFLKRVLNVDELAHPAIETKEWDSTRKVLFGFIDASITSKISYDRPDPEKDVIGYVFIPDGNGYYQRELIDTFEEDGGLARIETVFFANADNDKEREIAITVSWRQMHRGASIDGYMYDTYLYDNPDPNFTF